MTDSNLTLDRSTLRVNPATIVVPIAVAFAGNWPRPVAAVRAVRAMSLAASRPMGLSVRTTAGTARSARITM